MKMTNIVASIIATFGIISTANAAELTYSVGGGVYKETYREKDTDGSAFMKEEANMASLNGRVRWAPGNQEHAVTVFAEYARGNSDYTGAYQGKPYGSLTLDNLSRSKVVLGVDYVITWPELAGIQTGVGLTYRQLTDRLDEGGVGGYKRVNDLSVANFSVARSYLVGNVLATPRVGVNYLVNGRQYSYVLTNGGKVRNKQDEGYGYYVEVDTTWALQGNTSVTVTPYWRQMNIAKSDVVAVTSGNTLVGLSEPKNITRELGVSVRYNF